jgi:hypothetical protein
MSISSGFLRGLSTYIQNPGTAVIRLAAKSSNALQVMAFLIHHQAIVS